MRNTSEFVRLDQPTLPGPELPFPFYYHCMAKINEDLVVFTGGVWSEKTTLVVNVTNNFEMVEGSVTIYLNLWKFAQFFQKCP